MQNSCEFCYLALFGGARESFFAFVFLFCSWEMMNERLKNLGTSGEEHNYPIRRRTSSAWTTETFLFFYSKFISISNLYVYKWKIRNFRKSPLQLDYILRPWVPSPSKNRYWCLWWGEWDDVITYLVLFYNIFDALFLSCLYSVKTINLLLCEYYIYKNYIIVLCCVVYFFLDGGNILERGLDKHIQIKGYSTDCQQGRLHY